MIVTTTAETQLTNTIAIGGDSSSGIGGRFVGRYLDQCLRGNASQVVVHDRQTAVISLGK